jgi:hypothetical protein
MRLRALLIALFLPLSLGCARAPRPEVALPGPATAPDLMTLVLPAVDSATLAALSALLEDLQQQRAALTALTTPDRRFYTLFRDLETLQAQLDATLSTADAQRQLLYDRLVQMSANMDYLFRTLERVNLQPAP